jgi:Clp amino terminal domain, pathogenicity island component/UvrB/uvrC motif
MYPFERFTEDAKKTLTLAQEEAERSHHSYIGTEHLLLGLLRVEKGTACRVLTDLGVDIGTVREVIKSVLGRNERIIVQQIIPTSRVKKVIELSFEEARRLGHNEVDTGDILLGLIIEGEGIAAHVLVDLGAALEKVRQAMEHHLATPARERLKVSRPLPPLSSLRRLALREGDIYASEATRLSSLLKSPGIASLLKAKGVDTDTLAKQLDEPPADVLELRSQLAVARHSLDGAVESQDFEVAARLRDEIIDLQIKLGQAEQEWLDSLA